MALFTTAAAAVGAAAGGSFLSAIAPQLLQAAIGFGLNLLAQSNQAHGINGEIRRGADVPLSFILGQYPTAGSLAYHNEWGHSGFFGSTPNAYFTQVIALSDLPVKGLDAIWVDGEKCTLLTGSPHPDYGIPVQEYRKGSTDYLWVKFYDGTQTTADAFLVNTVSSAERPWESTAVFSGTAYVVVTARIHKDLWSSVPSFLFEVDGLRLYDPSKDSTVGGSGTQRYNDPATWGGDGDYLPAVQLYNLFRGFTYGGAWVYGLQDVPQVAMPVANWIAAIGACRTEIAHPDGGTVPTYISGVEVLVNPDDIGSVVQQLLLAMNARPDFNAGTFRVYLGAPGASVTSISDLDILSTEEQSHAPFKPIAERVNGVAAKYPDPDQAWQLDTAPPYLRPDLEAVDGGQRLLTEATFAAVPSAFQVQRLQQAMLLEAIRERRHTVTLPPRFQKLEIGDVIDWTSARNGYDGKLFRVDAMDDRPSLDVLCDLTEVDPSDYDFNPATDYTPPNRGSVLPVAIPAQVLPGFTVAAASVTDAAGTGRAPAILVSWTGTDLDDVAGIRVVVKVTATGERVFRGRVDEVEDGAFLVSTGILPAETYQVRALVIPDSHRPAEWTAWADVTVLDIRPALSDLADEVSGAIAGAQQTADQAVTDAQQAQDDAAQVQGNLDTFSTAITQDLSNAIAAADQRADEVRAEAIGAVMPLFPSSVRGPADLWTRNGPYGGPVDPRPAIDPATDGTFLTNDADFIEAFEWSLTTNQTLGPAKAMDFDPAAIYRIAVRAKVVDDGTSGGCSVRLGVTTQTGSVVVDENVQTPTAAKTVADGVFELVAYASADTSLWGEFGIPTSERIYLSGGAANKMFPHIRQNAQAGSAGEDARISIGTFEVKDVTEVLGRVRELRSQIITEAENAYATITGQQVAAASMVEAFTLLGNAQVSRIDGIEATLTQDYYTSVQVDGALAGMQTTITANYNDLSGQISDVIAAASGWQVVLDDVSVGTVYAAVSAATGAAAIGQIGTVIVTEQNVAGRDTSGATNGFSLTIPATQALQFGGQRVRISVLARQPASGTPATTFALAYSTSDNGNSGAMASGTLSASWAWHHFFYDVPVPNAGGVDYIGLFGSMTTNSQSTEFARVVVQIAALADELPEIAALQADYQNLVALSVDPSSAFGVLMDQLSVDAGGTSATVTSLMQGQSDVDGFANAFAGLTAEVTAVGGATYIAGIKATSWANPDGTGGSLLQLLGDVIVDGSLTATKLTIADLSSLVDNPSFSTGDTTGWAFGAGDDAVMYVVAAADIVHGTVKTNTTTPYVLRVDPRTAGTDNALIVGAKFEVTPGEELVASFWMALGGSPREARFRIGWQFIDSSGTVLSSPGTTFTDTSTDGTYKQYQGGPMTVPATAATARIALLRYDDVTASGVMWCNRFEGRRKRPAATVITDNSVVTDHLVTGAITTEKINGWAVTETVRKNVILSGKLTSYGDLADWTTLYSISGYVNNAAHSFTIDIPNDNTILQVIGSVNVRLGANVEGAVAITLWQGTTNHGFYWQNFASAFNIYVDIPITGSINVYSAGTYTVHIGVLSAVSGADLSSYQATFTQLKR